MKNYIYTHIPVLTMRETPSLHSKVVSQSLLSEQVEILDTHQDRSYIMTPDNYTGWVDSNALVRLDRPFQVDLKTSRISSHIYREADTEYGPAFTLPYGCQLASVDSSDARWIQVSIPSGEKLYIQRGDVSPQTPLTAPSELIPFAHRFLGLPYTWGGRSSFGFDCSGFVQMLYAQLGMLLKRDARLQILDKRFQTVLMDALKAGDLLFFGKSEAVISHVGMCLDEQRFIHATSRELQPWIRISHITDAEWSGHPTCYYPYRIAKRTIMF